jgi:hypothetical protein
MVVVDKEIDGSDKVERGDEEPEERTDPCREKRQSRQHSRCFSLSTSSWAMSRACYGSVFMRCPNSNRRVDSKRSELSPRCIASASSGSSSFPGVAKSKYAANVAKPSGGLGPTYIRCSTCTPRWCRLLHFHQAFYRHRHRHFGNRE